MWEFIPDDYVAGGIFILFLIALVIVGAFVMIVWSVSIGEVPWKALPRRRRLHS